MTVSRQLPPDKTGVAKAETSIKSTELQDDAKEDPNHVSMAAWFMVALLLMTNIHQQWTRALVFYIVSFKVPPTDETARLYMNIDLGFGEEQYGLLASFGFTLLFTICSLVAGRAADSGNRAGITAAAAAGWSVATVGQGLANSFDSVLGARALTGLTQAFTNPAAYGLIASTFPESRVSTANSIYSSAVYVGGALASLTILLDNQIGWRDSSLAIGALGLLLAGVSAVFLKDPEARPAFFGGKGGSGDGDGVRASMAAAVPSLDADAVGTDGRGADDGVEEGASDAGVQAQVIELLCAKLHLFHQNVKSNLR